MITGTRRNICFHGIGTPQRELEPDEDGYWTSVDEYKRILDEIAAWPDVRITFDDGNVTDAEHGLEPLLERGLTAIFFVLAGRIGKPGSLSANDITELSRHGMTIGTHGMHHRPWPAATGDDRRAELVEAKEVIAATAGSGVDEAAIPFGRYDRRLLSELRRLGYRKVHTSDRRIARSASWVQPRFSVRASDTAETVRADVLAAERQPRRAALAAKGVVKRLR